MFRLLAVLVLAGASVNGQVAIKFFETDSEGNPAYLASSNLKKLGFGTMDFFWFTTANIPTIQTWTNAGDWLSSGIYSNRLGTLPIGVGYSGATDLLPKQINLPSLPNQVVGQNLAIAVTSGAVLGVFRFPGVLPSIGTGTPHPVPAIFDAYLGEVNLEGVLVGSFYPNGPLEIDGQTYSFETYALTPEPSSLSLLFAGGAVLMAGRRRRV